jgi:hypothetical protein
MPRREFCIVSRIKRKYYKKIVAEKFKSYYVPKSQKWKKEWGFF